jgi:hypothetical protein
VIGGSKSGTHWINECLREHPDVYLTREVHELFFFDRYFDRGIDWYGKYFDEAAGHTAVGDITPTYLACPEAAQRIHEVIPEATLIVSIRNPVSRAWSKYLHAWRKGDIPATTSFRAACEIAPEIIGDGQTFRCLGAWRKLFRNDQIHLMILDDAKEKPLEYIQEIFRTIGVDDEFVPEKVNGRTNTHSSPRSMWLAKIAFRFSRLLHKNRLHFLVQSAKRIGLRNLVLKGSADKSKDPVFEDQDKEWTKEQFFADAEQLSELLGRDLVTLWDLAPASKGR